MKFCYQATQWSSLIPKQVLWIQMFLNTDAWVSGLQHFSGFCCRDLEVDRRHCNGYELRLSISQQLSIASPFNFTFRYIDDIFFMHNQYFENCLGQIYPVEHEIKDTIESNDFPSFLDLLLSVRRVCQLQTSIHDESEDINFHIKTAWVVIFYLRQPIAFLSHKL